MGVGLSISVAASWTPRLILRTRYPPQEGPEKGLISRVEKERSSEKEKDCLPRTTLSKLDTVALSSTLILSSDLAVKRPEKNLQLLALPLGSPHHFSLKMLAATCWEKRDHRPLPWRTSIGAFGSQAGPISQPNHPILNTESAPNYPILNAQKDRADLKVIYLYT